MKRNTYQSGKRRAREEAQAWQNDFPAHSYSYEELADFADHFRRLGKRYGLLQEFKENGII